MREQDQPRWKTPPLDASRPCAARTPAQSTAANASGSPEAYEGVIICITSDGRELKQIAEECRARRFLWPNDLVFAPNGLLYMTDFGIARARISSTARSLRANYPDLAYDGKVFEVDPASGSRAVGAARPRAEVSERNCSRRRRHALRQREPSRAKSIATTWRRTGRSTRASAMSCAATLPRRFADRMA